MHKRGVSHYSIRKFLSHSAEKFVDESLSVSLFSSVENFMHRRGMPRFSVGNFWSHNTGKFGSGTILFFKISWYGIFLWIRGGGLSRISVRNFLSYSAQNFRRGTILCCVSEDFR